MLAVIGNIIGDLVIRCSAADTDGACTWSGRVSELFRHREECAQYMLTAEARASAEMKQLRDPPTNSSPPPRFGDWFHLLYFLFTSSLAGKHVAQGGIVRMWAMMVFSILGVLEPGTSMPIFTSAVFLLLDELHMYSGTTACVMICLFFGWFIAVLAAIGTIRLSTQRPTPPCLVVTIGDTSFAMPGYYNIALTVIAGAIGFYEASANRHKYLVACGALVIGVLLPFAVRMYRRRLPLDDLPPWRSGIDDLSLLYLCTSVLSGTEIFIYCVFDSDTVLYTLLSAATSCASLGAAILTVTEACLLGCATRWQVVGAAVPLAVLALGYPGKAH